MLYIAPKYFPITVTKTPFNSKKGRRSDECRVRIQRHQYLLYFWECPCIRPPPGARCNSCVFHALPQPRPLCFDSSRFHACDTELKSSRRKNILVTTNSNRDLCLSKGQPPSLSYFRHSRRLSLPSRRRVRWASRCRGPGSEIHVSLNWPCPGFHLIKGNALQRVWVVNTGVGWRVVFRLPGGPPQAGGILGKTDTPLLRVQASRSVQPSALHGLEYCSDYWLCIM